MSECRSCHAPILWAKTQATGKAIPLDPTPVADGNLIITNTKPDLEVRYLSKNDERPELAHVSHFATCPYAAEHRKA